MMVSAEYQAISDRLIEFLPELRGELDDLFEKWSPDVPGPVNIFDEIFDPFLIEILKTNDGTDKLGRAFDFLEFLAESSDPDISGLVSCPTSESLIAEPELLPRALDAAGPRAAEIIRIVRDGKP